MIDITSGCNYNVRREVQEERVVRQSAQEGRCRYKVIGYCIFCRSGCERTVARMINDQKDSFTAISPRRIVRENRQGKWVSREMSLLPGYVFLYADEEVATPKIRAKDLYKILQYDTGLRVLEGEDWEYAQWIYRNHGEIGISKLIERGDEVTVSEGPLKDFHGKVLRIDRHKRRAIVEFTAFNKKQRISLSVEYLQTDPPQPEIKDNP